VFDNNVLKKIFGSKKYETNKITLLNEELHDLYSSPNIVPQKSRTCSRPGVN
jgi:hypothetical protein